MAINWTRQRLGERTDREIAERLGVSVELVRRERKRRGILACNADQMEWALSIDWDEEPLGEMSDVDLARRLEVSPRTVRRQRAARGIAMYQAIDWDAQPLGETRDEELAEKLGVGLTTVAIQRRARSIPPLRDRIDRDAEPLGKVVGRELAEKHGVRWCTKTRPEVERREISEQWHAPPRFRVNGPLSNMAEFREAFSCEGGSTMARRETDRCEVW